GKYRLPPILILVTNSTASLPAVSDTRKGNDVVPILFTFLLAATALLDGSLTPASAAAPTEVGIAAMPLTVKADDGVTVYGAYYRAARPKALILLFHKADSSKGEYATIAPRLVAAGYSALAIDQRSGGDLFGRNETASKIDRPADFLDAK